MILRPATASWFELLTAREELGAALPDWKGLTAGAPGAGLTPTLVLERTSPGGTAAVVGPVRGRVSPEMILVSPSFAIASSLLP